MAPHASPPCILSQSLSPYWGKFAGCIKYTQTKFAIRGGTWFDGHLKLYSAGALSASMSAQGPSLWLSPAWHKVLSCWPGPLCAFGYWGRAELYSGLELHSVPWDFGAAQREVVECPCVLTPQSCPPALGPGAELCWALCSWPMLLMLQAHCIHSLQEKEKHPQPWAMFYTLSPKAVPLVLKDPKFFPANSTSASGSCLAFWGFKPCWAPSFHSQRPSPFIKLFLAPSAEKQDDADQPGK